MLIRGDARAIPLADASVQCVVTSPPYWALRDYNVAGQIGLEESPEEFVDALVAVFREVHRVLVDDGTLWINLGDSYIGQPGGWQGKNGQRASRTFTARIALEKRAEGLKRKDLCGMPWRVALALQADGWYLRSEIIWHKKNPTPETVSDRPTRAHEQIFLLTKSDRYYYDQGAIRERASELPKKRGSERSPKAVSAWDNGPGAHRARIGRYQNPRIESVQRFSEATSGHVDTRNARSVWSIATEPFHGAHFATFPSALARRCILAGCPLGGVVFDPFAGSGTTVRVARELGREGVGLELSAEYLALARERIQTTRCLTA